MGRVRFLITALLVVAVILVFGCKSRQEQSGSGSGASPGKIAAEAPQVKPAAIVVTSQDKADTRAAATHVLSQLLAGNFSAIYTEAAPGFKQIGNESLFVAKFQETRQKVGLLKNPREISFETRPDNIHVLVYRLENDLFKTDMRLSFARAKSGKMELAGLNQHDEPKK